MATYMITSEPKEQFNFKGESAGMSDKRAIFFLPSVGKNRYYRQSISSANPTLKLRVFKSKSRAEEVCFVVNNACNDDFKVELLN